MRIGENKIPFVEGVEITVGKADTMYTALSNEIEKFSRVENFSGFKTDGTSVITGHKKIAPKF